MLFGGLLLNGIEADDHVEIIAHRRADGKEQENTIVSILQAVADNADWIEIDVAGS